MHSRWWPLVAICLGQFMLLLDATVVSVALPAMTADLGVSFAGLQWVIDIYALALAALLLGSGAAADIIGRRRAFVTGLTVFALASAACGLAPSAGVLVACRGLQGAGAALVFATTTAMLNSIYRGKDRGVAFGIWGATNGASSALGPLVGGVITQSVGWRWIFLVNLPISVVTIVLALAVIGESRRPSGRIDVVGTVCFAVAAGGLTYALIRAQDDGWAAPTTLLALALAVVGFGAFLVVQRRAAHPLVDLTLFRSPPFVVILVAGLVLMATAFAILAYASVWLQGVLGLSPTAAGLVVLPLAGCSFVVSAAGGRALQRVSPRWTIGGGLLLIGLGAAMQSPLSADSTAAALLLGLTVVGIGVGLAIPTMTAAALGFAPAERGGMVAGALNTARQLGYALGVAGLGLVFRNAIVDRLPAAGDGRLTTVVRSDHSGPVRDAVAAGLHSAYLVSAVAALAAGVLVIAVVRASAPHHEPAAAHPAQRPA